MNRSNIGVVWVVGLVLAVLLTVAGPDALGLGLGNAVDRLLNGFTSALAQASVPVREALRGFAIAAYVVFIVLCVLARRRRLPSMTAALVVTILFLMLVGSPRTWGHSLFGAHWFLALLLSLAGAGLMSRRLMLATPPPPRWRG